MVVHDVHTSGYPMLNLAVDGEHWYRSPPDFKSHSKDALVSKRKTALTKHAYARTRIDAVSLCPGSTRWPRSYMTG